MPTTIREKILKINVTDVGGSSMDTSIDGDDLAIKDTWHEYGSSLKEHIPINMVVLECYGSISEA